jgi:hypothetical protein
MDTRSCVRRAALLALAAGIVSSAGAARLPWPGDARADLSIPDARWAATLERLGAAGEGLGYTADEMAQYGRDRYILRTVANLFRDVRAIPRSSGARAEGFITDAGRMAAMAERAYLLTDISAGRMLPLPDSSAWGADWLLAGTPPSAALAAIAGFEAPGAAVDPAAREAWLGLPEPVQRLVVRLFVGAADAAPWLRLAYADPVFDTLSTEAGRPASFEEVYERLAAPWVEERLGQLATRERSTLEALGALDREYLAFGSVVFLAHLDRALLEYRRALPVGVAVPAGAGSCEIPTALGTIRILGTGADEDLEPSFVTLDLGGDDLHHGRHAVPASRQRPIALLLDLAGDDRYDGGEAPGALGCGLLGLGVVVDLGGRDEYRVAESGLGAAWFGTGIVMDVAGDDRYTVDRRWGQGAAHAGVGMLIDLAGDDLYLCGHESQGLGATFGAGVLVDVAGKDRYVARDDGNVSALYLNQSVAMSQGCGYGRRADLGDGHSLAGGFGVLVDGAGDDLYHAMVWSQGAGYWWGVGILEDLGGNDAYRNGKYSLGAAAHFAIGCQVDRSGDDRYNVGNQTAVNQLQGHARDGSIGVSIDGDGNDQYLFKSHCGGSGDLGSIGLFWDRRGDDLYRVVYAPPATSDGWSDTPPMGTTTAYPPFRSFRDDLATVGLFLDTGGRDAYLWTDGIARENRAWPSHRGPRAQGLGLDAEWFAAPGGLSKARAGCYP